MEKCTMFALVKESWSDQKIKEKVDFRPMNITKDKEGNSVMIKGSIHQ